MQSHPEAGSSAGHTCSCHVARAEDETSIEQLVDDVYWRRLGLSKPPDPPLPRGAQTLTLLARAGQRAVATLTLQSHGFAPTEDRRPLELEALYQLESAVRDPRTVAEVRRVAALPAHRPAVRQLYRYGAELCVRAGVRSWIGLVEAHGGLASDAGLVHRILSAHGLVQRPLALRTREPNVLFEEDGGEADCAVDVQRLAQLPLPGHVASFATALGARAIGIPCLHPRYRRLVVPMRASVASFLPPLRERSQPDTTPTHER